MKVVLDDGSLNQQIIKVGKNQDLRYILRVFAKSLEKEITFKLTGIGAKASLLIVYWGKKKNVLKLKATVIHQATQTFSQIEVKGVLQEQAQSFIKGLIKVEKGADQSLGQFTSKTLLLSEQASAHCWPFLEIKNNDVKVSHSVAVSQLNKEELFYLQSRGLNNKSSQKLLIDGFLK